MCCRQKRLRFYLLPSDFPVSYLSCLDFFFLLDAAEVESFIQNEEFIEKIFEEFFRCDVGRMNALNARQLLLACLHLEHDLRPLMPQQTTKHRQPGLSDAETILNKFGSAAANSIQAMETQKQKAGDKQMTLDCDQFLEFCRVLFRNVCAHVKL
jgi:hypothetical protein